LFFISNIDTISFMGSLNKKPLIGLSSNSYHGNAIGLLGTHKLYLNEEYVHAIIQSGGTPLILPSISELDTIHAYVNMMDGLLLTGGNDVNPLLYGEEPSEKLNDTLPERDHFEISLIKATLEQKKPILGICRGLQILNVVLGGTLYQDISSEAPGHLIQHRQSSREHIGTHTVEIQRNSKLHEIFGTDSLITNSFHHQAIKKLAPCLDPTIKSKDGIIEGVEMAGPDFLVAVQWHPECMVKADSQMLKIFVHFVKAAAMKECRLENVRG
jgi:putative glutamine amidotransferase